MFWTFWQLVFNMRQRPKLIVLENVGGALSSRNGEDFREICRALGSLNYMFGAVMFDAVHFVPQSRPRLFLIAVRNTEGIPLTVTSEEPASIWFPERLREQVRKLPRDLAARWRWWNIPTPPRRNVTLSQLIMDDPPDVAWNDESSTSRLLGLMSETNLAKVQRAQQSKKRVVGTVYRRTRVEGETKRQRAEVRFDEIAGCLRTPRGGSSRQTIIVIEGTRTRSRLLSKHEAAALMGYQGALPTSYNDAYHLLGDGLVVPVVRHLSESLLLPIVQKATSYIAA